MLFVKDSLITFPVSGFCFSEKNKDILPRTKPKETDMVDLLLLQSSQTSNERPLATNQKCNWFLF